MDLFAIIPAAGDGTRLGCGRKAAVPVAGSPMVVWSMRVLAEQAGLVGGVLVVHPDDVDVAKREWIPRGVRYDQKWLIATGGASRRQSVENGLAAVPDSITTVLVHDAARPLLDHEDLQRVVEAGQRSGAAILASPVSDTLKRVEGERVVGQVDRTGLYRAETPQVFSRELLARAHREVCRESEATDDAMLVEELGHAVEVVSAQSANLKVTTSADLELVEIYLRKGTGGP